MKLRTHPVHFLDQWFAPLLRLVWEPFSKKNSHFWNFQDTTAVLDDHLSVTVKADESAAERYRDVWTMFWATNFGDPKAVVIAPVNHNGDYRILYETLTPDGKIVRQRCSVILESPFGFLLTNRPVKVWGETMFGEVIELQVVEYTTRKEVAAAEIPLL